MIVVSDTTPLISLLKINRIDLVEKLFEAIMIPTAAYEEHELTSDEVRECVDGLQRAGRHIGQRHY
jgi:predicted nucleic acid-binding protein